MIWADVLVQVSEHESWVELIDINLWNTRVGEAMADGGVREDQDARGFVPSTDCGKSMLHIFTGVDHRVANLPKPGAT